MNITKKISIPMERCYSTNFIKIDNQLKVFFASEAIGGECIALDFPDLTDKENVWDNKGGTMSIVAIPQRKNEFLAIQNFFPGYNSKEAKVVWVTFKNGQYETKDFIYLPYLHRFDLIEAEGKLFFVGCTLCSSKVEREDWSDPGKIYVGELPDNYHQSMELHVIKDNLTKNHGFLKKAQDHFETIYCSSMEGVFKITPPHDHQTWSVKKIFDQETSEVEFCDLDNDGQDEMIAISPFHGDKLSIFKNVDGEYKKVWENEMRLDFLHSLWAGEIQKQSKVIVGARKGAASLFMIAYNKKNNQYETEMIEDGAGSANIAIYTKDEVNFLASANHTNNEAVIYVISS